MDGNINNRVRKNVNLPKDKAIMPIFEAVINAIHSIEDSNNIGSITINLNVQTQKNIEHNNDIINIDSIDIIDNGVGFNEENFNSFKTQDSTYKSNKGCKGIGRLLFLKVFERVEISSVYKDKTNYFKRDFTFTLDDEVKELSNKQISKAETGSSIKLITVKKYYRNNFPKKTTTLARYLLDHFYAYFLSDNPPNIKITNGTETVYVCDLYDIQTQDLHKEKLIIKTHIFELTHVRKRTLTIDPTIVFCADSREVCTEKIKNRGFTKRFKDHHGEFSYACYISSSYLNDNLNAERGEFTLPKESYKSMFEDDADLSIAEIKEDIMLSVNNYLANEVRENILACVDNVKQHVKNKSPEYGLLLTKLSDDDLYLEKESPKDIDLFLHEKQYLLETAAIQKGQLLRQSINSDDFDKQVSDYLQDIEDIQKMDLASYVCHRKAVIDVLTNLLINPKNTEAAFHDLIFKRNTTDSNLNNLWLIDDSYLYFKGFSDKRLCDISYKGSPLIITEKLSEKDKAYLQSENGQNKLIKRPDILLFPEENKVLIIEFKKPNVNVGEFLDQAFQYARIIAKSSTCTFYNFDVIYVGEQFNLEDLKDRDPIHSRTIEKSPGFYVVPVQEIRIDSNRNATYLVNIVKYSALLNVAKLRNQIFFEKLGLK